MSDTEHDRQRSVARRRWRLGLPSHRVYAAGRSMSSRPAVIAGAAVWLLLAAATSTQAQSGVPGGRLESAREHRAAVRAESYTAVASLLSGWREAWNNRDGEALARLYLDDASARLPGQPIVRGREPLTTVLTDALVSGTPIAMSDLDFESDGETAIVVSRYFLQRDGRQSAGIATAVLLRVRSGWRLRVHVFDEAQPIEPVSDLPR